MPRKKKSNIYFTQDTENAVIEYIDGSMERSYCHDTLSKKFKDFDKDTKLELGHEIGNDTFVCTECMKPTDTYTTMTRKELSDLYRTRIHSAFHKLAENIIHKYKFYYFDSEPERVIDEVTSHLLINISKYKSDKGKAFSYFSIVAKNYLILHNNRNYKHKKLHDTDEVIDYSRNVMTEMKEATAHEENSELMNYLIDYWENNMAVVFKRKKDISVADAVVGLMKNTNNIENHNKKFLYVLIREQTNLKTQHITRIINVMKKHNKKLEEEYYRKGYVNTQPTGSFF